MGLVCQIVSAVGFNQLICLELKLILTVHSNKRFQSLFGNKVSVKFGIFQGILGISYNMQYFRIFLSGFMWHWITTMKFNCDQYFIATVEFSNNTTYQCFYLHPIISTMTSKSLIGTLPNICDGAFLRSK